MSDLAKRFQENPILQPADLRPSIPGMEIECLLIYHGASADPTRYCLGAMLLDLHEPWKVLARSGPPIMEPTAPYEQAGFFGNVVFTNGHLVDGDELTMYYGASDSVICGARFSIEEILGTLR